MLKTKSLRVINGVGGAGVIIVAATAQAVNNNARAARGSFLLPKLSHFSAGRLAACGRRLGALSGAGRAGCTHLTGEMPIERIAAWRSSK